ncbi:PH domain [Geosmithia morbida]|uniref:PH domain n=1 Tax=Geosmithia morbida TaxID=1094350 RepID=A0A9P5D0Z3_9HYPO|nr:PH domain [Geosmithia morbida]KAF4123273.1 PH domain [Geosmithia morbida]
MAQIQVQRPVEPAMSSSAPKLISSQPPPPSEAPAPANAANPRDLVGNSGPVSQNGCFETDRVLKSGHVLRRTRKTRAWKSIYLVLRPDRLSIYKTDKEDKLRHQIYLSDLTAVAFLKDPKQKRQNMFGLFSPSRNYHLQANSAQDVRSWVDLIRREARIEEEEEEMFLAGPASGSRTSSGGLAEGLSSSPEAAHAGALPAPPAGWRRSTHFESSGLSGNELMSHSDMSDSEQRGGAPGASRESLTLGGAQKQQRSTAVEQWSAMAATNNFENDPDRIIWHGWLYMVRPKGAVRKWRHLWAVLRPRNLILYKDESEYTAQHIIDLSAIVNVVDIDPVSRSKAHCLQIITEEKSHRLAMHDEESLVQCIGAFKSLLAKRRELEARAAASANP